MTRTDDGPIDLRQVFIGGCDRSGTTLVGDTIGRFPGTVCLPESQFIHELAPRGDAVHAPADFRALVERHPRYRQWPAQLHEEDWAEVLSAPAYAAACDTLVRAYARRSGAGEIRCWVDHSPQNIENVVVLRRIFPNARFVHVVRDGRAVAQSLAEVDWGPSTMLAAADFWARALANGLAAEKFLPADACRQVRFEDFIQNFAQETAKLGAFLELGAVLEERVGLRVPAYTANNHALVGKPPDPARIDGWRRKTGQRDLEIFEASAGDLLAKLGYPPVHSQPRPASRTEHAVQLLREVCKNVRNRRMHLRRVQQHLG